MKARLLTLLAMLPLLVLTVSCGRSHSEVWSDFAREESAAWRDYAKDRKSDSPEQHEEGEHYEERRDEEEDD